MRTALALLVLSGCTTVRGGSPDAPVPWRDAPQCVGRVCAVSGTVAESAEEGAVTRLFFDARERDPSVVLIRSWLVSWPDYRGAAIVARGPVRRYGERVEVVARDPQDIEVLTATGTGVPPDVAAAAGRSAPEGDRGAAPVVALPEASRTEVERLRERVRELEEEIRRLKASE